MFEVIAVTFVLYSLALAAAWLSSSPGTGIDDAAEQEKKIIEIDALLPQTQCGDCGYPGCRPYARAIVERGSPIDLCPPGGAVTVRKLEKLLGRSSYHHDLAPLPENTIAAIDEETCIGCVKCIAACPVDAIIGSARQLHVVIPEYCTGCELCLPPCPVDCISMIPSRP